MKLFGGFLVLSVALAGCGARPSQSQLADIIPINEVFEPAGTFDPAKFGKVAVVQWNNGQSTPLGVTKQAAESFKQRSRVALERFIREAAGKGAQLILTPEFAVTGYPDIPELPDEEDDYRNREDIEPYVETVPGPTTEFFGALAKELDVYIHVGFAEVETSTDKYYNTIAVLGPKGQVVTKFHKMNLYQLEVDFLSPGKTPVTYQSAFGKIGLAACADIYSFHPMQDYKDKGANVIALSTSWAQENSGFDAFTSAARRYGFSVLASNQHYFPDSGVINPDGSAQSHIRQSQGIAYGYLPFVRRR